MPGRLDLPDGTVQEARLDVLGVQILSGPAVGNVFNLCDFPSGPAESFCQQGVEEG